MGWFSEDLPVTLPEEASAARLGKMRRQMAYGVALVAAIDAALALSLTQRAATPSFRVAVVLFALPFGLAMGWTLARAMPDRAFRQAVQQARRDGKPVQVLTARGLVALLVALGAVGFAVIYGLVLLTSRG